MKNDGLTRKIGRELLIANKVMSVEVMQYWIRLLASFFVVALGFCIPISNSGISIAVIAAALLALAGGSASDSWQLIKRNRFVTMAIVLYAFMLITIFYTSASSNFIMHDLKKYGKLLILPIIMPLFFDARIRRAGIDAFLIAMVFTLFLIFLKQFGYIHIGAQLVFEYIFHTHITTSFMMAFAAFIAAHRVFDERHYRWLYATLFLLMTYNVLFVSISRTGYLVYLALAIVFILQRLQWRDVLMLAIIGPILIAGLYLTSHTFRQRTHLMITNTHRYVKGDYDTSIGFRYIFLKDSLAMIRDRPIFGYGIGSFRPEYKRHHYKLFAGWTILGDPHNEYLLQGVEFGLVGVLLFISMLLTGLWVSRRLPKETRHLAQGLIIAFALASFCDSFLYLFVPGYILIYFSALLFAPLTNKASVLNNDNTMFQPSTPQQ